ncbi:MAG TPA: hypothetical protein VLL31_03215 [Sulfurovum sp.]|nr:hypothetical protein [Sulfurovum sp.]
MIRRMSLALLSMLCFTACTPRVGVGLGGVVASGDSIAASEVVAESDSGVHGSVSMGTYIGL